MSRRRDIAALVALTLAFPIVVTGTASAVTSLGWPFPSFFVDPFGVFSGVHLPGWGAEARGLTYPDKLLEIEGQPVVSTPPVAARVAKLVGDLAPGRTTVRVRFARAGPLMATIRRLDWLDLWILFALYAMVGSFVLWSGIVVLKTSERIGAAVAYFSWSIATCLFLCTFFDYHTHAWLYPLFSVSSVGMTIAPLWLAYAFPTPPRFGRRGFLALVLVATVAASVACLWILLSLVVRLNYEVIRRIVSVGVAVTMLLLGASMLARLWRSSGSERREIVTALWGLLLLPVLAAIAHATTMATGVDYLHLILPLLVLTFPLSIGYALIKSNLLRVRTVVSRRMLVMPVAIAGLVGSSLVWMVLTVAVRRYGFERVGPLTFGLMGFLILTTAGWRIARRLLFTVERKFRPTIERLSDQLATLTEGQSVRSAIEEVVKLWLPTPSVMVLDVDRPPDYPFLTPDSVAKLAAGNQLWSAEDASRSLLIPLRSSGKLLGVLAVAPKVRDALFTADDLAMLETVAGLGALALHNAWTIAEVDALRRAESKAAREDKRLTVASLSAEIAHEIAYPLNYFRHLLKRLVDIDGVDADEVEIGREEVERLSRMVGSLRKMTLPMPSFQTVRLGVPVRRALDLVRDIVVEKILSVELAIPDDAEVIVDRDSVVQVFANLLRNAAQAAPPGTSISVKYQVHGAARTIEIWDEGPGVPEGLEDTIFHPWTTTREGGAGLGLAVAQKLARSFGWTIAHAREVGQTVFRIAISDPDEIKS
jgi:signal transduction histidine kinase